MPTIYEIAESSGVSPKTAARILSGESQRSKSRDKVLECARRLGYVRNANAANLRTGRTSLVGILVPFINNPYYTQVIQGFHNALGEKGLKALVACSFGQPEEIAAALKVFGSYNVDGILINGSEGKLTPETLALLSKFQNAGKPVMLIGRDRQNLLIDDADIANVVGIEKAVAYLADKGHSRIAFLGGRRSNTCQAERLQGYLQGMEKAGLPRLEGLISLGENTPADGSRRARELILDSKARPTALVCNNDMMAIGAIKSIQRQGLSVPDDVAVVGFDDIELASLINPGLTTLRQPIKRIASDCVNRILWRIEEREFNHPERFLYEPELVVRESA